MDYQNKQKNYGLIIPKIETKEEGVEHFLGSIEKLRGMVINPSGDWTSYLPEKEPQNKRNVETFGCTIWGTLNALETLLKFKGYNVNYSDRYIALVGKMKGEIDLRKNQGANPHIVAELIRKITGCLREDRLPFSDDIKTIDDYYNISETILTELLKEGQRWYDEWELKHEWVFTGGKPNEKRLLLQQALQKGSVCVSVVAWYFDGKRYYKPEGLVDNHWVQLVATPALKYIIFDSYDAYLKELDPLYNFTIAKVFYLIPAQPKLSIIEKILQEIVKLIPILYFLVKKKLEDEAKTMVIPTQEKKTAIDENKPPKPLYE